MDGIIAALIIAATMIFVTPALVNTQQPSQPPANEVVHFDAPIHNAQAFLR